MIYKLTMYFPRKFLKKISKIIVLNIIISLVIFSLLYLYSIKLALLFLYCYITLLLFLIYFSIPILTLPIPSGNLQISTTNYFVKCNSAANNKLLPINIWFPVNSEFVHQNSNYFREFIFADKMTNFLVQNHFISNSTTISNNLEKYPIILLSHGIGSLSQFYLTQIQELVSNGFIVVGINHPNLSYLANIKNDNFLFDQNFEFSMEAILNDATGRLVNVLEHEVEKGVNEVQQILDFIEELNNNDETIFYNKFNLNNIGMLGHSIGGAITAEFCRVDGRCKIGASLDGSIIEKTAKFGFLKPFMFIVGYLLDKDENLLNKRIRNLKINEFHNKVLKKEKDKILQLCDKIGKDSYYIPIKSAGHFAFTDFNSISPILRIYMDFYFGANHKSEFSREINAYLLNFFNKYLTN